MDERARPDDAPATDPHLPFAQEPAGPLELTPETGPPARDPAELILLEAITAAPPPHDAPAPKVIAIPDTLAVPPRGRAWAALLRPAAAFLLVVAATMFFFPMLLARWRSIESQTDADLAYTKRRAELKAESEAAAEMLAALDQRVNLVSLGFREVVKKVTPNVVNILNFREPRQEDAGAARGGAPLVQDPDNERRYRQHGVGSGVIVQPGLILTNHHVIRGADRLRITFASGRSIGIDVEKGRTLLHDAVTDLAVIRLPQSIPCAFAPDVNLTSEFADSDRDVHRGDLVLALGSPLGLKHTVTHGIISAKGRLVDKVTLVELLQTDAAINPGNSGGPLFDRLGRLAGINVAIASDNGGSQGIGFAIPSNTARKVFDHLVAHGEVRRGYIGVALADLTRAQTEALDLKRSGGVLVTQVVPGQAAAAAGVKTGDVIVRYNREALSEIAPMRHLRQSILETDVGREVSLEVVRDGRRVALQLRIAQRPGDLP